MTLKSDTESWRENMSLAREETSGTQAVTMALKEIILIKALGTEIRKLNVKHGVVVKL